MRPACGMGRPLDGATEEIKGLTTCGTLEHIGNIRNGSGSNDAPDFRDDVFLDSDARDGCDAGGGADRGLARCEAGAWTGRADTCPGPIYADADQAACGGVAGGAACPARCRLTRA